MSAPGHEDPIVAIATASGRGAVGIVRVSGTGLAPLARALCGRELMPRQATYVAFLDRSGAAIDRGLARSRAVRSLTGLRPLGLRGSPRSID